MIYRMQTFRYPTGKIIAFHDGTLPCRDDLVTFAVDADNLDDARAKAIELRKEEERRRGNDG